ncbi:MAG: ABC transporter permease [Chitinispirillaceae bacterium]|nr:ABC transporter permease [Chitinispirillaceae bacterium]
MNRMALMVRKEFLHIRNDKLSVRLMIFPVLLQLFILGYALVTVITNTPIACCDLSNTPQSRSLCDGFRHTDLFVWHASSRSGNELRQRIDKGEIKLGLIIPPDFSKQLLDAGGAQVQVLIDGQDANSSMVASEYLNAVVMRWGNACRMLQMKKQGTLPAEVMPLSVNPSILFNPLLKSTWFMIPALVVLLVTMVTGLLSGLSIVKEKESGTLEQLMVTPLLPAHLIFGKTVPYFIIGLFELTVFLVLATLWFGIPFRGNVGVFFLFGSVYMLSSLGIGMFTSTVARTPQQVLFLIWFILIFFILLSGFFIPVENMPLWVQRITMINPVKYFMFAVREIFLKGSGLAELWRELAAMGAIGAVVFSGSLLLFHRRVS